MIKLTRSNSDHPDFVHLVGLLDAELAERDGNDHSFYAQFNKIDRIRHAIIAYLDDIPVACGAMKEFSQEAVEVKRMFTISENRGKGIAGKVLAGLEAWAGELGFKKCVLETGKRQPEAIELYIKHGYKRTENYGQYIGIDNSVCFEKIL